MKLYTRIDENYIFLDIIEKVILPLKAELRIEVVE